jgi:hypothetical protein
MISSLKTHSIQKWGIYGKYSLLQTAIRHHSQHFSVDAGSHEPCIVNRCDIAEF